MEWVIVVTLIVLGITFLIIEVVFIPGTTIAGIIGAAMLVGGVYLGFEYFGSPEGWYILMVTFVLTAGAVIWALRSKSWERFSLKTTIGGKVNEDYYIDLEVGMEGKATSALRPMGKAEIGDKEYEVRTIGQYVDTGGLVTIIKIDRNRIYVEPKVN